MRGSEMSGWLRVDAEGVRTKRALAPWVRRGGPVRPVAATEGLTAPAPLGWERADSGVPLRIGRRVGTVRRERVHGRDLCCGGRPGAALARESPLRLLIA